jgi:phytoene synthase
MGTVAELEGYATRTSSSVMALAALILNDGRAPGLDELTRHAGIAYAVAGLLSAFAIHAARGQLYLPLDLLHRHQVHVQDILSGTATPQLRAALAELRSLARWHLAATRAPLKRLPPALLPALLPVALAAPALDRMERRGHHPFIPQGLPLWRRQWLLWRAARDPARIAG